MAKALVFAEFTNGKLKSGVLELLSATQAAGLETVALAFGPGAKSLASETGAYGVKTLFVNESNDLQNYNSELFTELAASAIQRSGSTLVLASGSSASRDFFPRVAARLSASYVSDCTWLDLKSVKTKKPFYSGKCTATVSFENAALNVILMRPNQLTVDAPKGGATSQIEDVALPSRDLKTIVKEVIKGATTKLDLTEANVIVAGGRGLKGPEHFKMLHDLADVIGATVGASRAVVDAGWVPHGMQVGQTGKTVAPSLYIAVGISGAIQHLAGMSSSKVIVAINKDPEAPIFKKATYGIVGDAFEVVPLLTEEFKKLM